MKNRLCALAAALAMLLAMAAPSLAVGVVLETPEQAVLTFSDESITETVAGTGYIISGTSLAITAAGTYRIGGSCAEGAIVVSKQLSGVTLILDQLMLSSAQTAPIVIKKSARVLLVLEGASTLTDNEDAATEATNDSFEGAAIKVKSGGTLTISGSGSLQAAGNAKNGIKGGAESALIVESGAITATAANNGMAFDGSMTINGGALHITAANDGLKSVPDEGDTASAGTITVNGGDLTIRAQGDGIQAANALTINNGTFDIQTESGYTSTTFDPETMSCKGLKATGSDAAVENAESTITVTGGTFLLNTADDAIHANAHVAITGGTFDIYTHDDGIHADTTLTLGSAGGYARDPEINIYSSKEGLETGTLNAYSGKYWINAADDGVNAAGGSANGSKPLPGSPGHFNPGGMNEDFALNFYGGDFYVNCGGDGLDANGPLNLYGGNFTILSQGTGGDNSPLDCDTELTISGATVFAAGINPMNVTPAEGSQNYCVSRASRTAGTVVNVSYNGEVVYSEELVRNGNYLLYSSPAMTSPACTVAEAESVLTCKSNAWAHNWGGGEVETPATTESAGVLKYTCADCGKVERKTIPMLLEEEQQEPDPGYAVTFVTDGNATINVYYTQDYSAPQETGVTAAVSRNSATGEPDSTGNGQVNFTVVPAEGYAVSALEVSEGTYKSIKGPADTGLENTYRITKITGDTTVTVTTEAMGGMRLALTGGTAAPGKTATVQVAIAGNTEGVAGLVIQLSYDSSVLTLTEAASAQYMVDWSTANKRVSLVATENVVTGADEPVATLTFSVAQEAAPGDYPVSGAVIDATQLIVGPPEQYSDVEISSGSTAVTLTDVVWGDADDDGSVTMNDAILLLKYLADLVGPDEINLAAANVDLQGDVEMTDAIYLLKYLADLVPALG